MKILTYIGYGCGVLSLIAIVILIIFCAISKVSAQIFITMGVSAFFGATFFIIQKIVKAKCVPISQRAKI